MMLAVPAIYREGVIAAHLGTHMSDRGAPMGFAFCPYRDESVERYNWIGGAVAAYMGSDAPIAGEH